VSIRGNVDTRLAKLEAGEVDATLLAAAGLDRLGRHGLGVAIGTGEMLPAPAQGAIGIECRADDAITATLLDAIDHRETHQAVLAERAFVRALGGTCHSPIAAYARIGGGGISFDCEILSEDGREHVAKQARFGLDELDAPERLARSMLAEASPAIRRLFEG
jgi:hydroxymethylbilane synthase